MVDQPRNQVVCPRCGEVRLETPPGTTVLPTLGTARKAALARDGDWACDCGRRRGPGAHADAPGADAAGPTHGATDPT